MSRVTVPPPLPARQISRLAISGLLCGLVALLFVVLVPVAQANWWNRLEWWERSRHEVMRDATWTPIPVAPAAMALSRLALLLALIGACLTVGALFTRQRKGLVLIASFFASGFVLLLALI
jgi:DNA-binding helix-hairpin-helix protein with protein kinase domain